MQLLWATVHGLEKASKRMRRTIGVTGPQRLVLRIVGLRPGISPGRVAEILRVHPSTLTGVLARLEERGLILRSADLADRRRARFTLTAAGKKIDRERKGTVEAAVRRAIGRASDSQLDGMISVLRLLVEELERDDW